MDLKGIGGNDGIGDITGLLVDPLGESGGNDGIGDITGDEGPLDFNGCNDGRDFPLDLKDNGGNDGIGDITGLLVDSLGDRGGNDGMGDITGFVREFPIDDLGESGGNAVIGRNVGSFIGLMVAGGIGT